MKNGKKIVTGIFVVLSIIVLIDLLASVAVSRTNRSPSPQEAAKSTPAPKGVSVETITTMMEDAMDRVFTGTFDYDAELDEDNGIYRVNVYSYDIDKDAVDRIRENGPRDKWNDMVKDLRSTVSTMQQSFDELGHDEITVVLNVCDPIDMGYVFLTIADGVAGYDVVNGIDLLNVSGDQ